MARKTRKGPLLLVLLVGFWLVLAAAVFADVGAAKHSRAIELTPTSTPSPISTVTPTATPTSFPTELALITITVRPSSTSIVAGERLTVSVHIAYQPRDCSFAMYDLTLRQPFSDTQWFRFLSPERLGPPAPRDAEFTLQALTAGAVRLTAELYGEEYCGFWQWSYRYGYSPAIVISPSLTPIRFYYLPWISR